jgi:hypothetical protein
MDSQSKAIVAPYIGKWISLDGKVKNILIENNYTNVFLTTGETSISDLYSLSLSFDRKKWRDQISVMQKGDNIDAACEIMLIDSISITLHKCELIVN